MKTLPEHIIYFSVEGFVPGVAILAVDADAPVTKEWLVASYKKLGNQGPKVLTDIKEVTLPDGSKAYAYKAGYISGTGYEVEAYALERDIDGGKRMRVIVYTVVAFAEYDEPLFAEIAQSLTFK